MSFGYDAAISIFVKQGKNQSINDIIQKSGHKNFPNAFPKKFRNGIFMFIQSENKIAFMALTVKPALGLLPLLASKKYPYVKKHKPKFETEYLDKLPVNGVSIISDDPKSPLNAPDCFELVNELLAHHGYYISIDDVRRSLVNIEEESNESAHVDQLLQNL